MNPQPHRRDDASIEGRSIEGRSIEGRLHSLSLPGPDPELRQKALDAGRRRLRAQADLLRAEPSLQPSQPWVLELVLAAAILLLAVTVPGPQLWSDRGTEPTNFVLQESNLKEQQELVRILGTTNLGSISSSPDRGRKTTTSRPEPTIRPGPSLGAELEL